MNLEKEMEDETRNVNKTGIRVFGAWFGRLTLAESFRKNAEAVLVMNRNNYDNFQSIMNELEVADLGRNLMLR